MPTEPPFTEARPREERLALLGAALDDAAEGWALSGSLAGWGDPLIPRFGLAVFLSMAPERRLARLRDRERVRHGTAIEPGGPRYEAYLAFMDWAKRYDTAGTEMRSRALHEAWIAELRSPVLRLDGALPVAELVAAARRFAERAQLR